MSDLHGILLARHGETDDNRPPLRFQGWRDTPLNDTGREQAHGLAERLSGCGIAAIWSSDLIRARETAEIVGERLRLPVSLDARLREGSRGRWEGHRFEEIERQEPELYAAWRDAEPSFRFPGGETLEEQQARVKAALGEIHAAGALPSLVVCHGGSIRVMLCTSDPRGLRAFHTFELPNTVTVEL